jgi:hypothetical protein
MMENQQIHNFFLIKKFFYSFLQNNNCNFTYPCEEFIKEIFFRYTSEASIFKALSDLL